MKNWLAAFIAAAMCNALVVGALFGVFLGKDGTSRGWTRDLSDTL